MNPVIQARELSRWYGMVMGLNNVSFDIAPGLTGLVGPNGAGKSTLIQIITGQLQPSAGTLPSLARFPGIIPPCSSASVFARSTTPCPRICARWIGSPAWPDCPAWTPRKFPARCEAMLDTVKLPREHWCKTMGQYSKGMKQRVKLAQGLLHQPDLLVLDEPMNGLDPMGRQEVADLLAERAAGGASILISSHILAELESLCRNILILNWGRILASGSQQEIRGDLKNWSEELSIQCDAPKNWPATCSTPAYCSASIWMPPPEYSASASRTPPPSIPHGRDCCWAAESPCRRFAARAAPCRTSLKR